MMCLIASVQIHSCHRQSNRKNTLTLSSLSSFFFLLYRLMTVKKKSGRMFFSFRKLSICFMCPYTYWFLWYYVVFYIKSKDILIYMYLLYFDMQITKRSSSLCIILYINMCTDRKQEVSD